MAQLELERRQGDKVAIGIVHADGHLLRTIKRNGDVYIEVDEEPKLYIAEKLEPIFTRPKRLTAIIGGRASGKSIGTGDLISVEVHDDQKNALCLREFQSSISDSVHGLLKSEITRLELKGFNVTDQTIAHDKGGYIRFNGLSRNPESVKSAFGFSNMWVEESQFLSDKSLKVLTPTARNKPVNGLPSNLKEVDKDEIDLSAVKIIFTANPNSSADPFSQRLIVPFKHELDKNGIYEDDLHLIIVMNWRDNPWYKMSGVEAERKFDMVNTSQANYDWIWEGKFNDEVDGSIIKVTWFDAAIDAHKLERLEKAFKPQGARIIAYDPMDDGNDAHGYASRHGSIIERVECKDDGEIDVGCDWATDLAINDQADWFVWDGDGMGTGLKRQVSLAFKGKSAKFHMFSGALSGSGQDNADLIYQEVKGDSESGAPKTYADTFKNNRAQYYILLAQRFYNTYKCVVKGEYVDPAEMISLNSEGIESIERLRSELCRIPRKINNTALKQIMSKAEMKKLGISSPNMADAIMMTLWGPEDNEWPELDYPEAMII
jgi:phage terminase large subunit